MSKIPPFSQAVLENVCRIIGDTDTGLTGTQIGTYLAQEHIEDTDPTLTKWKRLYNAFANFQNKHQCSNNILNFIKLSLSPARYVDDKERFDLLRNKVNQQLAFVGFQIKEDGNLLKTYKASTISDVQIKADNLKHEIENRKGHPALIQYCKAELLANNYFHAVFEANKGLFARIRELSGLTTDGNALIEEVFSQDPFLIINNYQTKSEKDEHKGFCNILKGLCGMFRNTESHEPKVSWEVTEQDALEILGIISYCHRRLDKAQKIRQK